MQGLIYGFQNEVSKIERCLHESFWVILNVAPKNYELFLKENLKP